MATTTNYSWTTPDDTALVKDGASAIRSLGTAIDTTTYNNSLLPIVKTIVDAKGDIIAATAADTVARLAVGTNGQVLTADSTAATGLAYTTISAGAYTTISSASLSSTSVTISAIPGTYKELVLVVEGATATTNNTLALRINGITSATYETARIRTDSSNTVTVTTSVTELNIGMRANSSTTSENFTITFPNYTSTVGRINGIFSGGNSNGGTSGTFVQTSNAAITSITLFTVSGGTFNGGTYALYGVK